MRAEQRAVRNIVDRAVLNVEYHISVESTTGDGTRSPPAPPAAEGLDAAALARDAANEQSEVGMDVWFQDKRRYSKCLCWPPKPQLKI